MIMTKRRELLEQCHRGHDDCAETQYGECDIERVEDEVEAAITKQGERRPPVTWTDRMGPYNPEAVVQHLEGLRHPSYAIVSPAGDEDYMRCHWEFRTEAAAEQALHLWRCEGVESGTEGGRPMND